MAGTCEDALGALSARLGIPLEFRDGTCEVALVADDLPDAPSRQLTADLLNLGFGMMHEGLPAVGRDPETGFLAAFAVYPCSRLVAAEFPGSFEKFVSFAMRLADRLEAERAAGPASPEPPPSPPHGSHDFIPV